MSCSQLSPLHPPQPNLQLTPEAAAGVGGWRAGQRAGLSINNWKSMKEVAASSQL